MKFSSTDDASDMHEGNAQETNVFLFSFVLTLCSVYTRTGSKQCNYKRENIRRPSRQTIAIPLASLLEIDLKHADEIARNCFFPFDI